MESTSGRKRLLRSALISIALHALILVFFGAGSVLRELPPPVQVLEVELLPPPARKRSSTPVQKLSHTETRRVEPTPKESPSRSVTTNSGGVAAAKAPPKSDPYGELLLRALKKSTIAEGRDAPAVVEEDSQVSPAREFVEEEIEFDSEGVVSGEGIGPPDRSDAERSSVDLSNLDAALKERGAGGSSTSEPVRPTSTGEVVVELPNRGGDVRIAVEGDVADRIGRLPNISLSEELRQMLKQDSHPSYSVELGFSVTPEGIIRGVEIVRSSGNSLLDQELRTIFGVQWTLRPSPGTKDAQGSVVVGVRVK